MSRLELNSGGSNHVEQMDPAERFARLSPWQIARNTWNFAQEVTHDPDQNQEITPVAQFEYEGAQYAIKLQARGEHPKEITLHGRRLIEGEETHSFAYKITKKGVKREGSEDFVEASERDRLIPLMGQANLLLTKPISMQRLT